MDIASEPVPRFFFPDSPANAWFLTHEERIIAVERIKVNQAGVENKHFKLEQLIECLYDPKTWLFFFMSAIAYVSFKVLPPALRQG